MIKIAVYTREFEFGERIAKMIGETRREHIEVGVNTEYFSMLVYNACSMVPVDIAIIDTTVDAELDRLAYLLKGYNARVILIYVTEGKTAVDLLDAEPYKVVEGQEWEKYLGISLRNAITRVCTQYTYHYFFRKNRRWMSVDLSKVLYFYSDHRVVIIKMQDGKQIKFYDKLDNVETEVRKLSSLFMRINQSYMINKRFVLRTENSTVTLINEETFTIKWPLDDII